MSRRWEHLPYALEVSGDVALPRNSGDDADLLAAVADWREHERQGRDPVAHPEWREPDEPENIADAWTAKGEAIEARIFAMPARTWRGMAAKMEVAAHYVDAAAAHPGDKMVRNVFDDVQRLAEARGE